MKTVNLELSKQLKEAGYPQKGSYFTWSWYGNRNYPDWEIVKGWGNESECASPTADEILEQLPRDVIGNSLQICRSFSDGWFVGYGDHMSGAGYKVEDGDSLADAAAKMFLFLKKEGLI